MLCFDHIALFFVFILNLLNSQWTTLLIQLCQSHKLKQILIIIIITCIFMFTSDRCYHWGLSESKSFQISSIFLSNLEDSSNIVIWAMSMFLWISNIFNNYSCNFGRISSVPIIIDLIPKPSCFTVFLQCVGGILVFFYFFVFFHLQPFSLLV